MTLQEHIKYAVDNFDKTMLLTEHHGDLGEITISIIAEDAYTSDNYECSIKLGVDAKGQLFCAVTEGGIIPEIEIASYSTHIYSDEELACLNILSEGTEQFYNKYKLEV